MLGFIHHNFELDSGPNNLKENIDLSIYTVIKHLAATNELCFVLMKVDEINSRANSVNCLDFEILGSLFRRDFLKILKRYIW